MAFTIKELRELLHLKNCKPKFNLEEINGLNEVTKIYNNEGQNRFDVKVVTQPDQSEVILENFLVYTDRLGNKPNCQIIFVDTPGLFEPKKALEKYIVNNTISEINNYEHICVLFDATSNKKKYSEFSNIIKNIAKRPQKYLFMTPK